MYRHLSVYVTTYFHTLSLSLSLSLLQVFAVGSKDGQLYHMWQTERDDNWSDWEALGHLPSGQFASQPTLTIDQNGWWQAYAVSQDDR